MVYSLAENYIKESLESLKNSYYIKKREEVTKLLDYYTGTSLWKYIEDSFNNDTFREIPPVEMNFTKKFINKMARIYTIGSKRNVNNEYIALTENKDVEFKHVERMTRLLGTIATRITYDEDDGFNYKPIYFFIPHCAEEDPLNPVAISYPILKPTLEYYEVGIASAYWDDEFYIEYDSNGTIVKEIEHGMGCLPFVFTHRESQIDSFFVEGANDIISCNEQVNIGLTEIGLGMRFQMFGQPYITGVYEDKPLMRTGSNVTIALPEGAEYGIVSPQSNALDAIEYLKFMIEVTAQANHMWVTFGKEGDRPASGVALIVRDFERLEDYKDDIQLWRHYENKFYEKERIIGSMFGKTLPENFGVDFVEPEYPKNVQDVIARDDWDLSHNLITLSQIMSRENKDVTEKEAKKIIEKNKEENEELNATNMPEQFMDMDGEQEEDEEEDPKKKKKEEVDG